MGQSFFRRLFAPARFNQSADVLPPEFVQCVWGGPVGILRSKEKNGMGLVLWINHPGKYEIIHTRLLRRAQEPNEPYRRGG